MSDQDSEGSRNLFLTLCLTSKNSWWAALENTCTRTYFFGLGVTIAITTMPNDGKVRLGKVKLCCHITSKDDTGTYGVVQTSMGTRAA